ncbi:MAG: hypothetical protein SGJ02_06535 [bacterium]|nr:hypothetical protein [bacterium]
MKKYLASLLIIALIGSVGCVKKGPAEKAGERVDEIIDNVKDGDAPLKKKGPLEKAGESIDDTFKKDN